MGLTAGSKLGAYEIQSPLGAGGMGEVYRATDTKLGRDVALKVLPAEMAHDAERLGRFRREAKTLAQLDHPNIVTIYSVEESDGIHFLTMQLVDGLPLDRLICQGGLPVEQIIEISGALADALAAAHEKGIVHRDLKPANVMVSRDGRVEKSSTSDSRKTYVRRPPPPPAPREPYASGRGHGNTGVYVARTTRPSARPSHRHFFPRVVLHEMATGRRPFEGTSSAELVSAILATIHRPVSGSAPICPSDLARIVRRCLEKDPRHRLQTARDVTTNFVIWRDLPHLCLPVRPRLHVIRPLLIQLQARPTLREDEGFWVAVLPFKYSGSNADLTGPPKDCRKRSSPGFRGFPTYKVIARSSTARYAGRSMDIRQAGKNSARYVMEATLGQAAASCVSPSSSSTTSSGAHLCG